ncbi:MAG TPA: hypothetical protein PKD59_15500 [Miltoncostaeaceae bacterium]|nr:hypothetical protein [Miltoncostaeaceae bacterium]
MRAAALPVAGAVLILTAVAALAIVRGGGDEAASGAPASRQAGVTDPGWSSHAYDGAVTLRHLDQIQATGAGWVVLVPTCYQARPRENHIDCRSDETVDDAGLRRAIRAAHARGLRVMLKPHVDLPGDADRATIRPSSPRRWFADYTRMITHYAELARDEGVEQLSVGTELAGTSQRVDDWRRVIAAARSRFPGLMTYAANYDEFAQIGFWRDLDAIGIDAYWPLASRPTRSVATLVRAWRPIREQLRHLSVEMGRPVLFTEAGYVSQRGATTAPYSWTISRRRDDAEQAAAYEALLRVFWEQPWFLGVHWWMWDDRPDSGEPQGIDYTPHGKAAEDVLRQWWDRGAAHPG